MASREKLQLIEGEDYYWENGLMVFTARFHLGRGYCCKNDCRHCPYNAAAATTQADVNDGKAREANDGS
ncbi:MAG: DUF5522 domain-containing protein [Pyrinomonadaceae bacterium]